MTGKLNKKIFVFGSNDSGQLGLGHNKHQNQPILLMQDESIQQIVCGDFHSMILKKNGDLFVFGSNVSGQLGLDHNKDQNKPVLLMQDENIKQIVCGEYHSMILKKNGDLFVLDVMNLAN
jgi:alpha-tubulin suppressor-like RCC1 family protein